MTSQFRGILIARIAPFTVAAAGFVIALTFIHRYPVMCCGDPYLRVANRDHLLVDRWLPLLQVIIYLVGKVTPSITVLRNVLAAIAGLSSLAAYAFTKQVFDRTTGLVFAALLVTNPLFAALSIMTDQEVLFTGFAFSGLFFHLRDEGRRDKVWAAVSFNLACLTRYEGWILVGTLAVVAFVEETARNGAASGFRRGTSVGARNGFSAIGWLAVVFLYHRAPGLLNRPNPAVAFTKRAASYVFQIGWQTGNVALGPLAVVGLVFALRHREARRPHFIVLGFLIASIAIDLLSDPYSVQNLRQTYLPVVFVLFYGAFGLKAVVGRVCDSWGLARRTGAKQYALSAAAFLSAALSLFAANRFINGLSNVFDVRAPYSVGRWFEELPTEQRRSAHVVTLADNDVQMVVIAAHAGLSFDQVRALGGGLGANDTHVVYVWQQRIALSRAAVLLKEQLEDGRVPADLARTETAFIWTLRSAGTTNPPR